MSDLYKQLEREKREGFGIRYEKIANNILYGDCEQYLVTIEKDGCKRCVKVIRAVINGRGAWIEPNGRIVLSRAIHVLCGEIDAEIKKSYVSFKPIYLIESQ